ncbi:MAG: FAD-dependent oxidoreductase [Microbacteriaceae bacterium]|jgi:3-phenylpropionate/trans-cinnamate dioxygenase ferredoxin reductase subunit|nr:FAD-dependent oxidoreductase [Microbacteriaceae bacterium]HPZ34887.1 FAD-dependent oxidoreductase [Microbacteriaceae bacterium]HQC92450.1 FAD-dependent oxidoreductase [Microbacteriaceae bacterium]
MSHFVIVGGGLAAASAAETLRTEGFEGEMTVVTRERHAPYQRPPLSKGYLAGKEGLDEVIVHPAQWYAEQGIDLRTATTAARLDPAAHTVTLGGAGSDGGDGGGGGGAPETLRYDKLLLATGAVSRTLPIEGAELDGVYTLRTLDEADALRRELGGGGRSLVLIGSGWIGMEVGATARGLGNSVTILEREAVPLAVAVGPEMGTMFRRLHEANGVDLRTQVNVERIVGRDGHVTGVVVDGETVPADVVLIGVGAVPAMELARDAQLAEGNGILVDAALRTSAPDVFAAGDVASAFHPVVGRHQRSEHWANALNAGPVAARSMLGLPARFAQIPYFYTDQFDLGMELSGYPSLMAEAKLVIRGDIDRREFIAFWVDHGRVVGGMNVNVWDVNEQVQELISSGETVDLAALRDPSTPLERLLAR